jgi:hypothetical protein
VKFANLTPISRHHNCWCQVKRDWLEIGMAIDFVIGIIIIKTRGGYEILNMKLILPRSNVKPKNVSFHSYFHWIRRS